MHLDLYSSKDVVGMLTCVGKEERLCVCLSDFRVDKTRVCLDHLILQEMSTTTDTDLFLSVRAGFFSTEMLSSKGDVSTGITTFTIIIIIIIFPCLSDWDFRHQCFYPPSLAKNVTPGFIFFFLESWKREAAPFQTVVPVPYNLTPYYC